MKHFGIIALFTIALASCRNSPSSSSEMKHVREITSEKDELKKITLVNYIDEVYFGDIVTDVYELCEIYPDEDKKSNQCIALPTSKLLEIIEEAEMSVTERTILISLLKDIEINKDRNKASIERGVFKKLTSLIETHGKKTLFPMSVTTSGFGTQYERSGSFIEDGIRISLYDLEVDRTPQNEALMEEHKNIYTKASYLRGGVPSEKVKRDLLDQVKEFEQKIVDLDSETKATLLRRFEWLKKYLE